MKMSFCCALAVLPVAFVVGLGRPSAQAAEPVSDAQVVRLSLVDGDVRVARGKEAERATGGAWGAAVANLPMEAGFSLATGTGRAEIELEDASMVYLGENSVLTFDELESVNGAPRTALTLVSGTATLHMQAMRAGESFVLTTPAGQLTAPNGVGLYVRVNSYLDALEATLQEDSTLHLGGSATKKMGKGQTITYYADRTRGPEVSAGRGRFAEWDGWVEKRVAARSAAMAAVMWDAGLAQPLPGLAEMAGQGRFFDCAPYGRCWEPTNGWDGRGAGSGSIEARGQAARGSARLVLAGFQLGGPGMGYEDEDLFPCSPYRVQQRMLQNGYLTTPYRWAVCNAGSWVYRGRGYAWVSGPRKPRQRPVRWVQYGHAKAFVPVHPRDVDGKTPVNLKHGVFAVSKDAAVEHVALSAGTPVKVLAGAPKVFAGAYYTPLQRAETPRLEAYAVKGAGVPIAFDHKAQSFTVARPVTVAGRSTTVTERFGQGAPGGAARGGAEVSGRGVSSGGGSRAASGWSASSSSGGAAHGSGGASSAGSSGGASGGGSHH
jgi:hypothetical protein